MDFADTMKIWADTLTHKHECGNETAIRATLRPAPEAQPIELWIPDFLDESDLLVFHEYHVIGDLLASIASHDSDESETSEPRVFLTIARRHEGQEY